MDRAGQAAAAQLARELQLLKRASGLSYARISQRTHYAKSSWERWLNGKRLPPRTAIESIARATEGNAERLLDLWDLASRNSTPETSVPDQSRNQHQGRAPEPRTPASPTASPAGHGLERVFAWPVRGLLGALTDVLGGTGEGPSFVIELRYSRSTGGGWRGGLSLSRGASGAD